ncbi:MAG: hypothetical protein Tsb0020_21170 [Haliangiales bacterium]
MTGHIDSGDEAAILALLERQRRAWNRGDVQAFMDGYARDDGVVFTSNGQVWRGWQGTLERYLSQYGERSDTMGQLEFEILDVRGLGAGGAVVLGRWQLRNPELVATGVFTLVLENGPSGWRIVHDHTFGADVVAASAPSV